MNQKCPSDLCGMRRHALNSIVKGEILKDCRQNQNKKNQLYFETYSGLSYISINTKYVTATSRLDFYLMHSFT